MKKMLQEETRRPEAVSFASAFVYWLKLGFISFGGPAGQISIKRFSTNCFVRAIDASRIENHQLSKQLKQVTEICIYSA